MGDTMNSNPLDNLIGKILSKLPNEPLRQTQFLYYLQTIIVVVLIFFTINNLYFFISKGYNLTYLFGAIITMVFFLMTLFSYKSIRQTYLALKSMPKPLEMRNSGIMEETPEQIEQKLKEQEECPSIMKYLN